MGEAKRRRGGSGGAPIAPPGREDATTALEGQRAAFVAKFGREPGPGDPVFFDSDADTPQPYPESRMMAGMVVSMMRAGMPERLIYSYIRTGVIALEGSEGVLSTSDRYAIRRADAEYERDFGSAGTQARAL